MPISVGATTYKFQGKAKKGESPLTLAKKILNIQEDVFAAQNDGVSINDPMQLDYLIDKASELYGLAKDEGDRLDIEGKVAKWEAQKSQLERKQDVTLIGDALEKDTRDIRYQYFSRNVGNPLQYLADFTSSYSVLQLVGQGMVDQLTDQRRFSEADSLQKIINKGNELVNTYNDLHSAETVEDLKNFAVTYQTDLQGRVKDMKVLPVGEVKTGYVSLVDGNTGKSLLMDGMQVYVNQQEFDGKKLWKLGGKGGDVAPIDAGLAGMFGDLQEKEITGAEAMGMMLAQQKGVPVGLWKETSDLNDPMFRNSIVTSDPIINTLPGEYFSFADGSAFRNNREGKLDEI